jgi:hypothetical protein
MCNLYSITTNQEAIIRLRCNGHCQMTRVMRGAKEDKAAA